MITLETSANWESDLLVDEDTICAVSEKKFPRTEDESYSIIVSGKMLTVPRTKHNEKELERVGWLP